MKAQLIFDLDEAEDRQEYKRCNLSLNMASAIWQYDQHLREEYKYNNNEAAFEQREKFREFLTDNGIDIDNIMQ
jgi:hypothetical protein